MKKAAAKVSKVTSLVKKAATKIVKKPAAAPAKAAAPVAKKSAAKASASVKAPASKAPVLKAPAVKGSAANQPSTVITALINVGFGNALYLRGEGPGLSWEVGVPLDCVADDKWSIALPGNGRPVIYKFLINDVTWSTGSDYIVESGSSVTVVPSF